MHTIYQRPTDHTWMLRMATSDFAHPVQSAQCALSSGIEKCTRGQGTRWEGTRDTRSGASAKGLDPKGRTGVAGRRGHCPWQNHLFDASRTFLMQLTLHL